MSPEGGSSSARAGTRGALRVAFALAAAVLLVVAARRFGGRVDEFLQVIDGLGFWAPLVFVLGYAAATVAFVPGSLLTLAGGALFGLAAGTLWVFLGATLGATAAFLVSRYLARAAIERKVKGYPRFAAIDRAVMGHGFKIVLLLRLSPVFPFVLLNYALGLTRVRLRDFVLASIGMLPATVLFVYFGKLAGDLAAAAGGDRPPRGAEYYLVLGAGLLATVVVTTLVTRIARRALAEVERDTAPVAGAGAEEGTP